MLNGINTERTGRGFFVYLRRPIVKDNGSGIVPAEHGNQLA